MSLSSGRYQLAFAFKNVQQMWEDTQQQWRDQVRDDFAEHHWFPLATRVSEVLSAMDALEQVLARMEQDCGEGEEVL